VETTAEKPAGSRHRLADLPSRVAFALPAIAVAVALVAAGGDVFAAGVAAIGALALTEACRLLDVPTRMMAVALAGVIGLAAAVALDGREALAPALAAAVLALAVAAAFERQGGRHAAMASATLAVVWIGFGVTHAILLRDLPHGGALMLDVLLAAFLGDTAAHLLGSLYGRTKLAPRISPNKTVEGLLAGVAAGTAVVCVVAVTLQDWLSLADALALGLAAAVAAPAGDLFESMIKRDAGVKDSGALLGPHGGVLDRVDAVLFAVVAGYYVAVALL
jgi:phosphatidate cytidylyltransferase